MKARRVAGPAAVRRPISTMSVMRAGRKGLAMIVVTLAFLSSVAYLLPNSSALASSPLSSNTIAREAQTMTPVSGALAAAGLVRDDYTVTSKPKQPPPPPPSPSRTPSAFTASRLVELVPSSSSASLQWPVPGGTKMSYGYGPRNCSGCSSFHQGADFNAPSGSPAWSIADGVVTLASPGSGPFGVHVVVQHLIDGEVVTTLYAHMLTGSLAVGVGDSVTAGQAVGGVGCTGSCTGTHLHFEIHPGGGAPVDPVAWMRARLG